MAWKKWTYAEWNKAILSHFFGIRSTETPDVVSHFLVVGEELAQAAGALGEEAEAVLGRFENAVRTSLRHPRNKGESMDLLSGMDVITKGMRWNPDRPDTPPFLSHLFLTCVAASISDEVHRDERSFHKRLQEILGCVPETYNQAAFKALPEFWKLLAQWTEKHGDAHGIRRLVLPEIRQSEGKHLIGYSEKLSFPDRRDIPVLAEILQDLGHRGGPLPPVAVVISAVGKKRKLFTHRFEEAFDEFVSAFNSEGLDLSSHRFWSVITEAHQRARASERNEVADPNAARLELFGEQDEDGEFSFFLGSRDSLVPAGYSTGQYVIPTVEGEIHPVFHGAATPKALSLDILRDSDHPILELAGPLGQLIGQGVVPLAFGSDNLFLELCSGDLPSSSHALVRRNLVSTFEERFGGTLKEIDGTDWILFDSCKLRLLPRTLDQSDPLAGCWCLQENLTREKDARFIGGIKCDSDWLWIPRMLPRLISPDAVNPTVVDSETGREVAMTSIGPGMWGFDESAPLQGAKTVRWTTGEGSKHERMIRFVDAPAHESPREVKESTAWLIESLDGVVPLSEQLRSESVVHDVSDWLQDSLYLGRDIGTFGSDRNSAVWEVTFFGERGRSIQLLETGDGHVPQRRVTNKGLCRRWRILLDQSTPIDERTRTAQVEARSALFSKIVLPLMEPLLCEDVQWASGRPQSSDPAPGLSKLISFTVAAGNARSGLRISDWLEALRTLCPELPKDRVWDVLGAWEGAGLIDHLQFLRWNKSGVFPRRPRLLLGDTHAGTVGYLDGLALPTTLRSLKERAERRGVRCFEIPSCWSYLPSSLRFSGAEEGLRQIAADVGVPHVPLSLSWMLETPPATESRRVTPFSGYLLAGRSEAVVHHPPLDFYDTCGGPRIWAIELDGNRHWSHSRNIAVLNSMRALGRKAFGPVGRRELFASGCRLPLPIARTASALGDYPAYSPQKGEWRYSFPSASLRDFAVALLDSTSNPDATDPVPLENSR